MWLSRDGDGDLRIWTCSPPVWSKRIQQWNYPSDSKGMPIDMANMDDSLFPEVKPGECKEVVLTIKE